jgi:uncharacterized protein (DUF1810 family)
MSAEQHDPTERHFAINSLRVARAYFKEQLDAMSHEECDTDTNGNYYAYIKLTEALGWLEVRGG